MNNLILFLLLLIGIQQSSYGNDGYVFNKLTTYQGLSHSTVYAITQDHKGFVWIGTREGLNRYDSYGIKTYYSDSENHGKLSSSLITSLLTAHDGTLYIGTAKGLDVYDYKRDLIRNIKFEKESLGNIRDMYESSDSLLYICSNKGLFVLNKQHEIKHLIKNSLILTIKEYKRNVFWLASRKGVFLVNQFGEIIKSYPYLKGNLKTFNNVSCIFKDSDGEIWIGTNRNGLYYYSPEKDAFEPIIPEHKNNPVEVNMVRAINEDDKGNLWIGTESGLFIYDKQKKHFSHYTQSFDKSPHALNDKSIYCIFKSSEDIMWLGTYFGGVNFVRPKEKGFFKLTPDGGEEALSGKAVSQITEDQSGNLWIGTEDGGISVFNQKSRKFSYFTHSVNKNSISCNNVHAIEDDGEGNIWIGTFLGGLNRFYVSTKEFSLYKHEEGRSSSISHNNVFSILRDSRGTLWVGTWSGVNVYNYEKDNFSSFKREYFSDKFIYDILEDHNGNLWFCTRHSGIIFYNVKKDKVTWYNRNSQVNYGLNSNEIICAYQDSQKRIWFGSLNGGLIHWDSTTHKFSAFTKKEGLANNNVYGILEDGRGNLWVSTNKGITVYNPETKDSFDYNVSDGLKDSQFNLKSFYKNKQGWMYFGTVNGLYYFHPDSLIQNNVAPGVHFTDLKLFNKSVEVDGENAILDSHIDETKKIVLAHEQNVVTFEFAATNFFSPGKNDFSYYLEGFENGWNKAGSKRTATYTNLSPGTYTFHVKAANNDGTWSGDRQVQLIVKPPLWLTNWAITCYILLVLIFIYLYRRYLNYRHQEKMAYQLEKVEKEKMKELNQHKLNFFTYISHEFKTPLTLIIASIEKFLNSGISALENNLDEFYLIKRNASRLHFLVDQLMEFRKIESDHATLNFRQGNVILFLQDTFSAFIPLYAKKNISYNFQADKDEYNAYFDADKVEKIVTNLLSNAIKNTKEFGEISMRVDVVLKKDSDKRLLKIRLADNGVGLPEGEAEKIFMPFYQGKHEKVKSSGSGIGLALVHSLTKYLNGSINIESSTKKGTVIDINLPLYENYGSGVSDLKVIDGNKSLIINQDLFDEEEEGDFHIDEREEEKRFELMIVEDNKELLKFLVNYFSDFYKIIYAENGKIALDEIKKRIPDAIISDVVMPEMDGVALCKELKSNISTSHIPFILLTAKSTTENKLEGLDVGADAYLPKPFNLKELALMIKNALDSRNNLKRHFLKFGSIENYDKPVNNKDHDFLNRLLEIVNDNLEDPEFNIAAFTKEAGVSRTLLHLKLKQLVNLSASEFVRTIRLQKATRLLKEGCTVAEIAFMVGFKDPNYFSRSFKEKYGMPPSEYRETACQSNSEEKNLSRISSRFTS